MIIFVPFCAIFLDDLYYWRVDVTHLHPSVLIHLLSIHPLKTCVI